MGRSHLVGAGVAAVAVALIAAVSGVAPDDRAGGAPDEGAPEAACTGVPVVPDDDLQRLVDDNPEGTTFCLLAGVHHPVGVVPKDRQRFVGEGQATILSGAQPLRAADARRDDAGRWYWSGQRQRSDPYGELVGTDGGVHANPGDRYNEELFTSTSGDPQAPPKRWQRVLSVADLGPGRWFLDEAAGRIYLTEDPARLGAVETSLAPDAIVAPTVSPRSGVLIANLVVQRYASPAQHAVIGGPGALAWEFRHVTVRDAHGAGAELGPGSVMENCSIQRMGQVGLLGGGEATDRPTVLRNTEVTGNKALSFDPDWEAGGAKFTRTAGKGMVVENSWFHDNPGGGLWFDIDNYNVVVRSNRFERNNYWGVDYEVSRHAQIYWNVVIDTSPGPENFDLSGVGILVFNSADVQVTQNLLAGNTNGILLREDRRPTRWAQHTYREGIPHIQGVVVSDNDIATAAGGVTGMQVQNAEGSTSWWQPSNARFSGNTYRSAPGELSFLGPGNNRLDYDQWRALGNDTDSVLLAADSPGSLPPDARAFVPARYGALARGE
jgi:hypothetical protein